MLILSIKPGHDASMAVVADGQLLWAGESEKDSHPRHEGLTSDLFLRALARSPAPPDMVCVSGWVKGFHSVERPLAAGYFGHGTEAVIQRRTRVFGRDTAYFSSSHERSHLICAYGLSPLPQGEPCYSLIWEGNVGTFYEIDERVRVTAFPQVMRDPGNKYAFVFALADPTYEGRFRFEDAGKLMALAAFADSSPATATETATIDAILDHYLLWESKKDDFRWSPYHDIGLDAQTFRQMAGRFSDALFDRFLAFAKRHLTKKLPLLIAGGCGLNCEWNSRWRDCGLFPTVFVPPCTNDSGSAVGTAIDAQWHMTGNAKLRWRVDCGDEFEMEGAADGWTTAPLHLGDLARRLTSGEVVAWVQGRCELGPRALGFRSLLAAPFSATMLTRLNTIKQREGYRPIAPVCLEEDAAQHFGCREPSPHMLYFQPVMTPGLAAVTHVDGSARPQTVSRTDNPALHALLTAFKAVSGTGVLCNTSLNFKGRGFINRLSDLADYCTTHGVDAFVVGDRLYHR